MRCARTAVGQCMIVRRGFGCVVKSSSTLVFFNRFCHGKFTCLFNLFLLVRGRVPRSLFRFYGLNFSVVVTCHCSAERLQDVSWIVFSFGITCFIPIYGLGFRGFSAYCLHERFQRVWNRFLAVNFNWLANTWWTSPPFCFANKFGLFVFRLILR